MLHLHQLLRVPLALALGSALTPNSLAQESLIVPPPSKSAEISQPTPQSEDREFAPLLACLRIPALLITKETSENFRHTSPVNHVVLGTHACGTAVSVGQVNVELQERTDGVEFLCNITGVVTSRTSGVNGPATIDSTSNTSYTAVKRILFDGRQLTAQPAVIGATTRLQITGVGSTSPRWRGRLVRRVATRRAAQSLSQAQAITRHLAVSELQQQIDAEFQNRLVSANRNLAHRLSILDAFPRSDYELLIHSQKEFIEILLTQKKSPDPLTGQNCNEERNTNRPLNFPNSDVAVLWLQLPEMNLLGLDSVAELGLIQASSYMPLWLSSPLSRAKFNVAGGKPSITLLRHENWIGIQFDPEFHRE